jgi:enoyl-CoA hydratase/carnithine racemase
MEIDTGTTELLCSVRDGVALITLNRPEARNAMSDKLTPALRTQIRERGEDADVGAILITGAGTAFCSGGDVKGMGGRGPRGQMTFEERLGDLRWRQAALTGALVVVRKPTIAALPGAAAGAGLAIALACDIRIAATTARFALPEVKIGSMAGSGGTQRLGAVVGPTLAARMILTGEPIDAERALASGLVSELCAPGKLMETAMAIAATIARNAPLAVIASKRSMRLAAGMHVVEELDFERMLFKELALTEDRAEGRAAFREKRAPVFKGK